MHVRVLTLLAAFLCQGFFASTSQAQTAIPLNILWRVKVGSIERMLTRSTSERDEFPLEGAIFYVPKYQNSGTVPLYRLDNGRSDRTDSRHAGRGYRTKTLIGYPWSSNAVRGLSPIIHIYNPSNGDRALRYDGEGLPADYQNEGYLGYGYKRFNNHNESLLSLNAGGVTIQSNRVAGGALWTWTWNGMQFINVYDYGRQMQAALFFGDGRNPTEAGDLYSHQSLIPSVRHGSPVLNIYNSGNTQSTRSIPLQWDPAWYGERPETPVIYPDIIIGKDITLNFKNMGPVAKYTTVLWVPTAYKNVQFEIPTVYLRANFNRFWTYNAASKLLKEVFPGKCQGNKAVKPAYGGVIISDATGNYAMGVYGVNKANGGSVSYFALWNFLCNRDEDGTSATGSNTTKWNAVFGPGMVAAGETRFNTWIITERLTKVTKYMDRLYTMGVK